MTELRCSWASLWPSLKGDGGYLVLTLWMVRIREERQTFNGGDPQSRLVLPPPVTSNTMNIGVAFQFSCEYLPGNLNRSCVLLSLEFLLCE